MKKYGHIAYLIAFFAVLCLWGSDAYAAEGGVFGTLAIKTETFAENFRHVAYVIAGFGVIVFTFGAIFGKISFRQLGILFLSLFILSAMGTLINWIITGKDKGNLSFSFNDTYTKAIGGKSSGSGSSGSGGSGPNSSL